MIKSDIEIREEGGATIAILGVEYDNLNDDELTAASKTLLGVASRIEPPKLILDLSQTRFFASAFLGACRNALEGIHDLGDPPARWG